MTIYFGIDWKAEAKQDFRILIVYSDHYTDKQTIANIERVFLYYTENVYVTNDFKRDSINDYTHIVLLDPENFLVSEREWLEKNFLGSIIYLGLPFEQLNNWERTTTTIIEMKTSYTNHFLPITPINRVIQMNDLKADQVILLGKSYTKHEIPLLIREGNAYYLLTSHVANPLIPFLIEGFHSEFHDQSVLNTQYQLQITDVDPLVNLENLTQLTDLLLKRNIPFSIEVIPIVERKTDEKTFFLKDNPELIALLKEMQGNGIPLFVQASLQTKKDYSLEHQVEKLVKEGLYPIGINYGDQRVTLEELKLIKKHVSTVVANIYANEDRLYQPAQVKGEQGVVLTPFQLPVEEDLFQVRSQLWSALRTLSVLPDQQVSILFPAYESINKLELVISLLKEEKGQWINLLDFPHFLETENIEIFFQDGEYQIKDEVSFLSAFKRNISLTMFEALLWLLAFFVLITNLLFALQSWRLRKRRRYVLFKEKRI